MCTVTYDKPELQIAKEDIVVYKHVKAIWREPNTWWQKLLYRKKQLICCMSPYRDHIYKIGKVYTTHLSPFGIDKHSRYCSYEGFYSWKYKQPGKDTPTMVQVKCIIPKGARYYLAHDWYMDADVYTSNKIKIVSLL